MKRHLCSGATGDTNIGPLSSNTMPTIALTGVVRNVTSAVRAGCAGCGKRYMANHRANSMASPKVNSVANDRAIQRRQAGDKG